MSRIEKKAIASFPSGVFGIINQKFGEEHIDKVGSSHGSAGMSRFCFFYHRCREDSNIIRSQVHQFFVVHCAWFLVVEGCIYGFFSRHGDAQAYWTLLILLIGIVQNSLVKWNRMCSKSC